MLKQFTTLITDETVAVELPMSKWCNLRCSYCYITDEKYKIQHVDYITLRNIVDRLPEVFSSFRKKDKKLYLIPWGAEPLCNWKVIENLLREELSTNANLFTKWSTNATIIPNGYLNFIKEFLPQIENIQISLDGPEEVQNETRKYQSGRGSFHDVIHHLDIIRNNFPTLSVSFKPTLSSSQIEKGFFYKSVKFFLVELKEPVAMTSFVTDAPYSIKALKQFREDLNQLYNEWDDILKINPQARINVLSRFYEATDIHCSACRNEVGIDLDGTIYPCHGPITGDQKQRDLYTLGNIFTGQFNLDGIYRFMHAKYTGKLLSFPQCANCPVNRLNPTHCYTCPFDSLRGTNSTWMILPSVCEMRRIAAEYSARWHNDRT